MSASEAALEYIRRQRRESHPSGRFDGTIWNPDSSERQTCCSSIRSPSRAYPWSLMLHCRSIRHVASLYGVDVSELRMEIPIAIILEAIAGPPQPQDKG